MTKKEILEEVIASCNPNRFREFFREANPNFRHPDEPLYYQVDNFGEGKKLEAIEFEDGNLIVCVIPVKKQLTEKTGKKAQYELGKKILKDTQTDAGIFIFFDDTTGNFRFSLIYTNYMGKRRDWSNFRRFTYFVSPELTNKTFLQRIGNSNFSSLEQIKDTFSVEKVTKEFYQDISYWYFWAVNNSIFPKGAEREDESKKIAVIRLITRIIFIWFMREKGVMPKELFVKERVREILKNLDPDNFNYYRAILQNLFFATLNTKKDERQFRSEIRGYKGYNQDFGNQYVYRYHDLFTNSEKMEEYFGNIPFLNGGLFDCLDDGKNDIYIDGFTERKEYQPKVPNFLFFSNEQNTDLNTAFGTKNRAYKVQGLFNILSSFNFTIDENTPDDADIALDPELLGRVFENLLASFNPETSTTARKATGSYYTPREIVDYMVTQSLKEYFKTYLPGIDKKLDTLFSKENKENPFDRAESKKLIELIEGMRIVDPAVGSGAFPMGILNKMVFILGKIDPCNELWKQAQLTAANRIPDPQVRRVTKEEIEAFFKEKNADYGRKLYLIQKCIYGVDIQQIAVEIAKLRFFISLLVDEEIDITEANYGIEPLPNLDFKIMQGNSLISEFLGIDFDKEDGEEKRATGLDFEEREDSLAKEFEQKKIDFQNEHDGRKKKTLKEEVEDLLIEIFKEKIDKKKRARSQEIENIEKNIKLLPNTKTQEKEIAKAKHRLSKKNDFDTESIEKQFREFIGKNNIKPFFFWKLYFAEVFFEKGGFDIVIGNPPYIQLQKEGGRLADLYQQKNLDFKTFARTGDIYTLFYEKGIDLLNTDGNLTLITSNKWMRAGYGKSLRVFFLKHNPKLLIDLGPGIFESATVDTNILLIGKGKQDEQKFFGVTLTDEVEQAGIPCFVSENKVILDGMTEESWFIGTEAERRLKKKIEEIGKPLKEWDVKIYRGILTGLNEAFIIDTPTKERLCEEDPKSAEIIKPILRGRDIGRYTYNWAGLWLIFIPWHFPLHNNSEIQGASQTAEEEFKNQFPAIYNHLSIFKLQLEKRNISETGVRYEWYALQRCAATYYKEFEEEKVVWQRITKGPIFCIVEPDMFILDSMAFFVGKRLKFIISVLNSQLINRYVEMIVHQYGFTGFRLSNQYVEVMPIPPITDSNRGTVSRIEALVDKILALTKGEDSSQYEEEIDKLVCKLYDLTDEELRIILQ